MFIVFDMCNLMNVVLCKHQHGMFTSMDTTFMFIFVDMFREMDGGVGGVGYFNTGG